MNAKPEIEGSFPGQGSLSDHLVDAIANCVPALGEPEFTERFLDIMTLTGTGQATAFGYEEGKARCLLSRNFLAEEESRTLAAVYVDGWFREDPLFARVMAMDDGDCVVSRLEDVLPEINSEYFKMFFGEAGWRTKVAILIVQGPLRMVLNLYFLPGTARQSAQMLDGTYVGMYRLIGKLLATHFLRLKTVEFPLPLAVLSEREKQVCIGMLAGKKAEMIADEIGVGLSSVVTYRQRAYQKLGISSRGQLFSICRA